MDIYHRQQELELNLPESVTILGAGGIGWWAALFAAMSGVPEIRVMDYDRIDDTNLNRLPLNERWVGKSKVHSLRTVIRNLRPRCKVVGYDTEATIPFLEMTEPHHVIVCCIDKTHERRTLYKWCKEKDIEYVSPAYNGTHISLTGDESDWGEGGSGYDIIPSWVVPSSIIAAMAIAKVLRYPSLELSADIQEVFNG